MVADQTIAGEITMSMFQILYIAWAEIEWAVLHDAKQAGYSMNYRLMNLRDERVKTVSNV